LDDAAEDRTVMPVRHRPGPLRLGQRPR